MKCLVISETNINSCITVLDQHKYLIDLAEIRGDFLNDDQAELCCTLPDLSPVPLILTFRSKKDGGQFRHSENERLRLYKQGMEGGFVYIDLEEWLQSPELEKKAFEKNITIVRSFHDFDCVPDNLKDRITALARSSNEIPKAAVFPKNSDDFFKFFDAVSRCELNKKVVLAMGEYGFPSRILTAKTGSLWTYCAVEGDEPAPGHISPEKMESIYNYSMLNKETSVFGIIGNPVMHTKSPQIHNKGFFDHKVNAVYLPFLVDDVDIFLRNAKKLDVKGLSVTVPHKISAKNFSDSQAEEVMKIGSSNTLVNFDGSWQAFNTDAYGFLSPLKKYSLSGIKALVIGAGGAARAVMYALNQAGCDLSITNRTFEKAESLAAEFNAAAKTAKECAGEQFNLLVQTTSAGMHPLESTDPLPGFNFQGDEIVYDIIYVPEETVFLKRAAEKGCKTINGWPMLTGQAAKQFMLFCGRSLNEETLLP